MVDVTPLGRRTDFARYPHAELIRMLAESDPNGVTAAGDLWAAVGRSLHERANDLERRLADFSELWSGGAADKYRTMIGDLAAGIRRVAVAALEIRDLVHTGAEALQTAWLTMPAEGGEAAHREAVLVMTTLAERYEVVHDALRAALDSIFGPGPGQQPGGNPPGSHLYPIAPVGPGGRSPLFNHVFTAGIAAASAALGRQFVPARPPVPGQPGDPAPGPDLPDPLDPDPLDPDPFDPGLLEPEPNAPGGPEPAGFDPAALGGGSGGIGAAPMALAGGAGAGVGGPSAYPALSAANGGGPATAPGFAGITTGGGDGRPMGGAMVPPMPLGMMGGADAGGGGGRRIPPWLVETEDIWGESAVVTPAVIGEEPDAGRMNPGLPSWR